MKLESTSHHKGEIRTLNERGHKLSPFEIFYVHHSQSNLRNDIQLHFPTSQCNDYWKIGRISHLISISYICVILQKLHFILFYGSQLIKLYRYLRRKVEFFFSLKFGQKSSDFDFSLANKWINLWMI